jgi:hypothetical protein
MKIGPKPFPEDGHSTRIEFDSQKVSGRSDEELCQISLSGTDLNDNIVSCQMEAFNDFSGDVFIAQEMLTE